MQLSRANQVDVSDLRNKRVTSRNTIVCFLFLPSLSLLPAPIPYCAINQREPLQLKLQHFSKSIIRLRKGLLDVVSGSRRLVAVEPTFLSINTLKGKITLRVIILRN